MTEQANPNIPIPLTATTTPTPAIQSPQTLPKSKVLPSIIVAIILLLITIISTYLYFRQKTPETSTTPYITQTTDPKFIGTPTPDQ